jgi:hypothetical protein
MKYLVLLLGLTWIHTGIASQINFGTWYEFSFFDVNTPVMGCFPADPNAPECIPSSGTSTVFAPAPAWTFTVVSPGALLTVTDAFTHGDAFNVLDFGTLLGSTQPAAPGDFVTCGNDPVPCLSDPLTSKGVFALTAGPQSITITPYASPYGAGSAYFRVDALPEPNLGIPVALAFIVAFLWRRS